MKSITVGGKSVEVSDEQFDAVEALLQEKENELNGMSDLVGSPWFFRTVTYHLIGKVESIIGKFAKLTDAKVVFSSGNLSDALKKGTLSESEDVGVVYVNLDTVTDFFPWKHK
jgi:hypothetical protein